MRTSVSTPSLTTPLRRGFGAVTAVAVAALLALLAWVSSDRGAPPDFQADCEEGSPWFVASCFRGQTTYGTRPHVDGASVVLYRDTPDDDPRYKIATMGQTGAIWGLAYAAGERAVYAGAYHKRAVPHGPEGPGAVYRIDLRVGTVAHVFDVPDSGSDRHRMGDFVRGSIDEDEDAADWVGKTSLGDLEITPDGSQLFVMNLADRRIHRFSMPDGAWLGGIEHGAWDESWADTARPFGLAWHDGRLLHGVVNEQGFGESFVAVVYSSNADGSDGMEVARVRLDYPRERLRFRGGGGTIVDWERWDDVSDPIGRFRPVIPTGFPMPMLTDLQVASSGDLVIALRDRTWDVIPAYIRDSLRIGTGLGPKVRLDAGVSGVGFGDLLLGRKAEAGWSFDPGADELLDDSSAIPSSESALGGLASIPGDVRVVGTAFGIMRDSSSRGYGTEGAYWYDPSTGARVSGESVCSPIGLAPYSDLLEPPDVARAHDGEPPPPGSYDVFRDVGSLGDVESLCSFDTPTATPTDTSTPTATPTPSDTPTPDPSATSTPSPTATPIPLPIYLPLSLTESCDPTRVRADVALVLDASSSMTGPKFDAAKAAAGAFIDALRLPDDQVGIAAFGSEARLIHSLSGDRASLLAAIDAIEVSAGTRIDRGLDAGLDVLSDARPGAGFTPVLVLLTDGIQEAESDAPGAVAERIRASGVLLHVVGLGADVDAGYLRDLAGSADRFHLSPGPAELQAIYTGIARSIPCPAGAYWGRR